MEIWKTALGYEGLYEVSSLGRVRRVNGAVRKLKTKKNGYVEVKLFKNGKGRFHLVHRLIAEAFLGSIPEGLEVCHNNGDKTDNRVENLRYDTHSGNCEDRARHGSCHFAAREACPRGHSLDLPENTSGTATTKAKGWRKCKSCDRAFAACNNHPDLKPYFDQVSDYYYANLGSRVFYRELKAHLNLGGENVGDHRPANG